MDEYVSGPEWTLGLGGWSTHSAARGNYEMLKPVLYVASGDSVSRLAFDVDFYDSLMEHRGGLLALEDPTGFVEELLVGAGSDLTVHLWTNTNSDFSGIWGYRGTGEFDIGTNALVLLDALINCGF